MLLDIKNYILQLFSFKRKSAFLKFDDIATNSNIDNAWQQKLADKIIIRVERPVKGGLDVALLTRCHEVIKKIYNKDILLKNNEIINLNTDKIESLPLDNASITLPLIPFEISPAELINTKEEKDLKAYTFQDFLIEFIIKNKTFLKNTFFTEEDFDKLNEAFLFLEISSNEKTCCYICKELVNTIFNDYLLKLKFIIDSNLNSPDYSQPLISLLKKAYLIEIDKQIEIKKKSLLDEKQNTIKMAEQNNLNLFLPDVEAHYKELHDRLINFNYNNIINSFSDIKELFSFWPPWLKKPVFLNNKQTITLNKMKMHMCLQKLGFLNEISLDDLLKNKLREFFINKAKIKKENLFNEINEYLKTDSNLKELEELRTSLINLDIDKEFLDKDTLYSIILHWPELLYPEPIEIKACKDLLFDNLEILPNLE